MEKQLSATLRQYEVFVAIAETLHFGQAAANLGVAQPALTQQLKHLETVFGGELLFDRNRRRVHRGSRGQLGGRVDAALHDGSLSR